jgi:hypothetical protein
MYHTTTDPASEGVVAADGYYVPVGQPYDGIVDPNNTFPYVLAACPNFGTGMNAAVKFNPLLNAPGGAATCPNGLQTVGPLYPGAAYPDNQKGIVFQQTAGSIGGVIYLPYCSPGSIALGPTDIPKGWDGRRGGRSQERRADGGGDGTSPSFGAASEMTMEIDRQAADGVWGVGRPGAPGTL